MSSNNFSLYDAHTHLNDQSLFLDWQQCVEDFVTAGGKGLVNIGGCLYFNKNALDIANSPLWSQKRSNIFCGSTLGFHPHEVVTEHITSNNLEESINALEEQYLSHKSLVYAIGECGTDAHYDGGQTITFQQKVFDFQCKLARKYQLPIVVHSRDDFEGSLEVLKSYPDLKIYFHCFGYGPMEIEILQKLFPKLRIGFCGNVSYKKAENLRESLAVVPTSSLLLETDAPYLSPQIVRGTINTPKNIGYIYDFVAETLGHDVKILAKQIQENFFAFYEKNNTR